MSNPRNGDAPAEAGARTESSAIGRVVFVWDLVDGEPADPGAMAALERPPCKVATVRTFAKKPPVVECILDVPCPPWFTLDTLDKAAAAFESVLEAVVGEVADRRMKGG